MLEVQTKYIVNDAWSANKISKLQQEQPILKVTCQKLLRKSQQNMWLPKPEVAKRFFQMFLVISAQISGQLTNFWQKSRI